MKIIDIHTHGIGSHDTQTTSEDEILKIAEVQGLHGVTDIIPAMYPCAVESMRRNMGAVTKAMDVQKSSKEKESVSNQVPAALPTCLMRERNLSQGTGHRRIWADEQKCICRTYC